MLNKLRSYLELCRVHVCGLGMLCVVGGLTVAGESLSGMQFLLLYLMHVLTIAWSFAHNDYCDYELDRQAPDLQRRVLVRGDVSHAEALALVLALFVTTLLVAVICWPGWQPASILLVIAGCILAYNKVSKSFIGADVLFAAGGSLFVLLGAAAVIRDHTLANVPALTWIVFALSFIDHLVFNAIHGGLKDVVTDGKQGCITVACAGAAVDDDGRLTFRPLFKAAAWAGNIALIALYFLPVLAFDHPWTAWQLALMAAASAAMLFHTWQLFEQRRFDRRNIETVTRQRELASKAVLMCLMFSWAGWFWVLVIVALPGILYLVLNTVMNGHPFRLPQEF